MEHGLHYLIMANQSLLHKKLLAGLKGTGLTIGQPKVLEYLSYHDGASQIRIARACHIEAATLTSLLNRMEDKGLIQRRSLNGDRRTYYIFLTPQGHEMAQLVREQFLQLEAQALQGIPPEEQAHLLDLLTRISEHLMEENG